MSRTAALLLLHDVLGYIVGMATRTQLVVEVFDLTGQFAAWVRRDSTGVGFDSSTGFLLPNGAERAPDLAWVRTPRWNALTEAQRRKFPPLCPAS